MAINIEELRSGDVLSEISHYIVQSINKHNDQVKVKHLQTDNELVLGTSYVSDLLKTADQYQKEVKVGKEDKKWTSKQISDAIKAGDIKENEVFVGDVRLKGIKTLWQEIHSSQVFTVCFKKQDKKLTKKALQSKKDDVISKFQDLLDRRPTNKEIEKELQVILDNPIIDYEEGEDRILRGYKIQFLSEDGKYDCIDMDITKGINVRPVNINTIQWLVYDGVRYILE